MSLHGHNKEKDGSGMMWPLKRLKKMCEANERHPDTFTGWGWKEPNSHLFLECLNAYFPSLKYIHTIRHGLDMAYSRNLQQLYNWGPLFGIDLPKSESEIPAAAFRYWVESNRYTLNIGEKIGPERFLVVNFDQLCAHSENELKRLLLFLDVNPNEQIMEKMAAMPQLPGSSGRFKNKDLQWLKDSDLNFLLNRGFNVE
jgi:hypothetical protein